MHRYRAKAAAGLLIFLIAAGCNGGGDLLLPSEGEPAAIEVVLGNEQSGRIGEPLANPIVVDVTDGRDRPVPGATVTFELTPAAPGADIVPDTAITDAKGQASAQLRLGTTIGRQNGKATVLMNGSVVPPSATFTAVAVSENANSMAAVAGDNQIGHVNSQLDEPLVVQVTDVFGNPIPGVSIAWEAQGGGSVSESGTTTDELGQASVQRVLGPTAGQQTTLASSEGLAGSPVTFIHTALAGDASRLAVVSGDNQTGQIGSPLAADLVVRLIDGDGNAVPNTAVAWVVATGGGSVTPTNSNTDGDGRASARWTLGPVPGPGRVDAVVSGVGFVSFNSTATAGAPAALAIVIQPASSAQNGVRLARQPVIQLRDASGNAVARAGVLVSARIGAGAGQLTGTPQRITDSNGRATFTDLAIVGAAGRYTLVFASSGFASATSSDINLTAIPTRTTILSDSPDPSAPNAAFTVEFRVTSDGPVPTGSVIVTDGAEGCSGVLNQGTGSCAMALSTSGTRILTATYSGAPGLNQSSDTEDHRVEAPAPPPPTNQPPVASYVADCSNLTCRFHDQSTDPDGRITSQSWNFGDGSGSSEQNPTHTFNVAGTYNVILTVRDDDGASDDFASAVTVTAPPPPANKAPDADFQVRCQDLDCVFTDKSKDDDGTIVAWHWDFGDGQVSTDQSPSHSYSSPGKYQVTLTVTDNRGASDTKTRDADAKAPRQNQSPDAAFTSSCTDLTCSFNSDASADTDGNIVSRNWDFGDGNGSAEADPSHSYVTGGTYNVTLTVTDDEGATASVSHQVDVAAPPPPNQAPVAAFSPPSCTTGQPCQFTDASSDSDGIVIEWEWDFDDSGAKSTEQNPSHTYEASGTYNVKLRVKDDDGAQSDQVEHEVTVTNSV